MKIIPGNAQHIGSRQEQQDDFGFSDLNDRDFVAHGGVIAIIADGMGGLAMGRDASRLAKQTMLRGYESKAPQESIPEALRRILEAANTAVYDLSLQAGLEGEVGTTLVAAVIKDQDLHWISVGDSRIYLYRQGELCQLTTDHDYGRELALMVEAGRITLKEAAGDPNRRALTSYLGLPLLTEVDRSNPAVPLEEGDRILLCSDGLYGSLAPEEMAELLETNAQDSAELLIEAALTKQKSSQDNLTVAILACEREGFFHYLANLPILTTLFHNWRRSWWQLTAAALVGALCAGSGVWVSGKYWTSTPATVQVAKESSEQEKTSEPAPEALPVRLAEPANPFQAPNPAIPLAIPPVMHHGGQKTDTLLKPRALPTKTDSQRIAKADNQKKIKNKKLGRETINKNKSTKGYPINIEGK